MEKDDELVITRVLDAPKELVFKAWTEPEQIKRWWGPKGFTCPVAKVDLRKGGKYLYCMKGTEGQFADFEGWSGGTYIEVDAPNKLVVSDHFANAKGEMGKPSDHGLSPDFPAEMTVTVLFEDFKGKTKLSVIYPMPKSAAARAAMEKSGMEIGWNSSLDKLAEVVE